MKKIAKPTITATAISAPSMPSSSSAGSGFIVPSSTFAAALTPSTMPPSQSPALKRGTIRCICMRLDMASVIVPSKP